MKTNKTILNNNQKISSDLFADYMINTFFKNIPVNENLAKEDLLGLLIEHFEELKKKEYTLFNRITESSVLYKNDKKVFPDKLKNIIADLEKLGYKCEISSIDFDDIYGEIFCSNDDFKATIYYPKDINNKETNWLIDIYTSEYNKRDNNEKFTIEEFNKQIDFINKVKERLSNEILRLQDFIAKYNLKDYDEYEKNYR